MGRSETDLRTEFRSVLVNTPRTEIMYETPRFESNPIGGRGRLGISTQPQQQRCHPRTFFFCLGDADTDRDADGCGHASSRASDLCLPSHTTWGRHISINNIGGISARGRHRSPNAATMGGAPSYAMCATLCYRIGCW